MGFGKTRPMPRCGRGSPEQLSGFGLSMLGMWTNRRIPDVAEPNFAAPSRPAPLGTARSGSATSKSAPDSRPDPSSRPTPATELLFEKPFSRPLSSTLCPQHAPKSCLHKPRAEDFCPQGWPKGIAANAHARPAVWSAGISPEHGRSGLGFARSFICPAPNLAARLKPDAADRASEPRRSASRGPIARRPPPSPSALAQVPRGVVRRAMQRIDQDESEDCPGEARGGGASNAQAVACG